MGQNCCSNSAPPDVPPPVQSRRDDRQEEPICGSTKDLTDIPLASGLSRTLLSAPGTPPLRSWEGRSDRLDIITPGVEYQKLVERLDVVAELSEARHDEQLHEEPLLEKQVQEEHLEEAASPRSPRSPASPSRAHQDETHTEPGEAEALQKAKCTCSTLLLYRRRKLSKQCLEKIGLLLDKMDEDYSGEVSKHEAMEFFGKCSVGFAKVSAKEMLGSIDQDDDASLSRAEFVKYFEAVKRSGYEEREIMGAIDEILSGGVWVGFAPKHRGLGQRCRTKTNLLK